MLIVARSAGWNTVIEAHDDEPGVPDIYEHVIWERFERAPMAQSAVPGSGIGLAVGRGLVRAHGSDAWYRDSDRIAGACFEIGVPASRSRQFEGLPAANT